MNIYSLYKFFIYTLFMVLYSFSTPQKVKHHSRNISFYFLIFIFIRSHHYFFFVHNSRYLVSD